MFPFDIAKIIDRSGGELMKMALKYQAQLQKFRDHFNSNQNLFSPASQQSNAQKQQRSPRNSFLVQNESDKSMGGLQFGRRKTIVPQNTKDKAIIDNSGLAFMSQARTRELQTSPLLKSGITNENSQDQSQKNFSSIGNNEKLIARIEVHIHQMWSSLLKELALCKTRKKIVKIYNKKVDLKCDKYKNQQMFQEAIKSFVSSKYTFLDEVVSTIHKQYQETAKSHLSQKCQDKFEQLKSDVTQLQIRLQNYEKVVDDIRKNSIQISLITNKVEQEGLTMSQIHAISQCNPQNNSIQRKNSFTKNRNKSNINGIQNSQTDQPLLPLKRQNLKTPIIDYHSLITIQEEISLTLMFIESILQYYGDQFKQNARYKVNAAANAREKNSMLQSPFLDSLKENDISDENNSSQINSFDNNDSQHQNNMNQNLGHLRNALKSEYNQAPKTNEFQLKNKFYIPIQYPVTQVNSQNASPRQSLNTKQSPRGSTSSLHIQQKVNLANKNNILKNIIDILKQKIKQEQTFIMEEHENGVLDQNLNCLNEEIYQKIGTMQMIIKNLTKQNLQLIQNLQFEDQFHCLDLDVQRCIKETIPQILAIQNYKKQIRLQSIEQKQRELGQKFNSQFGFDSKGFNQTVTPLVLKDYQDFQMHPKLNKLDQIKRNQPTRNNNLSCEYKVQEDEEFHDYEDIFHNGFENEPVKLSSQFEEDDLIKIKKVKKNDKTVFKQIKPTIDAYMPPPQYQDFIDKEMIQVSNRILKVKKPLKPQTRQTSEEPREIHFKARPFNMKYFQTNFNPLKQPYQRKIIQKLSPIRTSTQREYRKLNNSTYISNNTTNIIIGNQQNFTIINQAPQDQTLLQQQINNLSQNYNQENSNTIKDPKKDYNFNLDFSFKDQAPLVFDQKHQRVQSVIEQSRQEKKFANNSYHQTGINPINSKKYFRNQFSLEKKVYTPIMRQSPRIFKQDYGQVSMHYQKKSDLQRQSQSIINMINEGQISNQINVFSEDYSVK
eukprot:403376510